MKAIKHFLTITKHRHIVRHLCFQAGIPCQGLFHDLSKYSPTEFWRGAKYYQGTRSPNDRERELFGYSSAWMHHKGRNKHHFEYWNDLNKQTRLYEPVKMPLKYVKEMLCDRIAASIVYRGKNYEPSYPYEYYVKGNAKNMMHPETAKLIESWLLMLQEKGQKETLKYLKSIKNNSTY